MFEFITRYFQRKEKKMGGDLEQTVQQKAPAGGGQKAGDTIIQHPPGDVQATASAPVQSKVPAQSPAEQVIAAASGRQSLRFHINGPEVHFHDDANHLKAAIPVADWYGILRQVQAMQKVSYVDPKFSTLLVFTPYIDGDTVECYTELKPAKIGRMLAGISTLKR